ncbi:hypothetical protein [Winogradskyella rapida]|uniref:Tetratricopeptide repeat protein n=1 Tax=Winogradskyella rapida TaxID=549701 RepID=A0ABW3KRE5_9FLAO
MQLQDLTYLLKEPQAVSTSEVDTLAAAIKQYPYFQPLRALYLKALKQKESYKYNNTLKTTAAYTTDRSVLFDFITSDVFNQNAISEHIKQNLEAINAIEVNAIDDITVQKSVTLDDALKAQIKATEGVLDPDLFEAKATEAQTPEEEHKAPETTEGPIIAIDVDQITPEKQLKIGSPLTFDKSENHSFTQWLKITSFKPIEREEATEAPEEIAKPEAEKAEIKTPLQSKLAIIDKFISDNPKIKPVSKTAPKPKLVDNDSDISDRLMTETLARIYLEQKNYDKAIQSYKILSLKYPEKSSFFAHQIKLVKELKDNNTI